MIHVRVLCSEIPSAKVCHRWWHTANSAFCYILVIAPTLKYDGTAIVSDTEQIHTGPKTVSCELEDAGPPLPELLELLVLEGSDVNPKSSENSTRDDVTCTWSYFPPLITVVYDITSKVRKMYYNP